MAESVTRQLPALSLVVLGIAAAVGPLAAYPHADQPEYEHCTLPVSADSPPDDGSGFDYVSLSSRARAVFDASLATNGCASVYDDENRPPEFDYGDPVEWGAGRHIVCKGNRATN